MKKLLFFCGFILFPLFSFSQDLSSFKGKRDVLDSIIVSTDKVGINVPLTTSVIGYEQLSNSPSTYSLPMVFSFQPSVVVTTEGGLGLGYSKISIRGSDASRVNVTLNGITVNDAESQEVFWVNIPFIQSFLQSTQIQRGAGTSSNGSAAFGGSINMRTASALHNPYGNAEFSYGSYGTYITSIAAGTGITSKGLSFDARYSHSETDGYIRNAKGKLNSLFTSLGWSNKNNNIKLNYIYGDQHTGITWEGISKKQYDSDRRYNVSGQYFDAAGNVHFYNNETDNYKQHHVQGFYTHLFSDSFSWNTIFNFTKGDGYYENYKADAKYSKYGIENQIIDGKTYKRSDLIVRQGMDNYYLAAFSGLNYSGKQANATAGVNYSYYNGDHFGDMIWCMYNANIPDNYRWYNNNGTKQEANIFIKGDYSILNNLIAYAEVQYRHIDYKLSGADKDFVNLDKELKYDFFNPKIGLTYNLSDRNKFYASVSMTHREPSRSDIKESIKAGRADDLKQEQLLDYEFGYKYLSNTLSLSANIYFMEYKNQLAATGKLSETGYVIMENVPDSYRRGIEFSAAWQIQPKFRVEGNVTLSTNKVKNYTAYLDVYDNTDDWNWLEQKTEFYKKSSLILSPEIISALIFTYTPGANYSFSLSGKYVGSQYMDNLESHEAKVPAYFVSSLNLSKKFPLNNGSSISLSGCIDNLFNNMYYSYGWSSKSYFKESNSNEFYQGIYPQAGIHFIAKIAYNF